MHPVVYVTYSGLSEHREAARDAGAIVVKMRGENETPPARCRNAGFRQLRKIAPDIKYVQFLDADHIINKNWIEQSTQFMERRPELAAIRGKLDAQTAKDDTQPDRDPAHLRQDYEIQTSGDDLLVRVKSFVDVGGFRGDLMLADVQDFCLRSRGRGRHIWHLDVPMANHKPRTNQPRWWQKNREKGFGYAYSAALHGVPPERYSVTEMRRAVLWGGAFPIILIALTIGVGILTYVMSAYFSPVRTGLLVLAGGVLVYFLKAVIFSFQPQIGRKRSLLRSFKETAAHFPEFFGVISFLKWRKNQSNQQAK